MTRRGNPDADRLMSKSDETGCISGFPRHPMHVTPIPAAASAPAMIGPLPPIFVASPPVRNCTIAPPPPELFSPCRQSCARRWYFFHIVPPVHDFDDFVDEPVQPHQRLQGMQFRKCAASFAAADSQTAIALRGIQSPTLIRRDGCVEAESGSGGLAVYVGSIVKG